MSSRTPRIQEMVFNYHEYRITSRDENHPIYLRPISMSDTGSYSRLMSHPDLQNWTNFDPIDSTSASALLPVLISHAGVPFRYLNTPGRPQVLSCPERLDLMIVRKGTERVVGICTLTIKNTFGPNGVAYRIGKINIAIDPRYQRRGYATWVLQTLFVWGFSGAQHAGLLLDQITMATTQDNTALMSLMNDKFGLRGQATTINGEGPGGAPIVWILNGDRWREEMRRGDWQGLIAVYS